MFFTYIVYLFLLERIVYGWRWRSIAYLEVRIHGFVSLLACAIEFIHDVLAFASLPNSYILLNAVSDTLKAA